MSETDLENVLLSVHDDSIVRRSRSIRQPQVPRQILQNVEEFLRHPKEWQSDFLCRTAQSLETKYDVIRWLCIGESSLEADQIGNHQHRWAFTTILELCNRLSEEESNSDDEITQSVINSALYLLGTILSAGSEPFTLKKIIEAAALALVKRDSLTQLRLLKVLDVAMVKASPCSSLETRSMDVLIAQYVGKPLLSLDALKDGTKSSEQPLRPRAVIEPNSIFSFGGNGSGIQISAVGKWPFQKEYCACFWFRLEEGCGKAHLLQMQTSAGKGISIALVGDDVIGYSLTIESSDEKSKATLRIPIPTDWMQSRMWHSVLVHHFTRLLGASVIRVFVDNQEVKLSSGYGFNLLYPSKMSQGALTRAVLFENFDGQAGPVYIFKEGVSPEVALQLQKAHVDKYPSLEVHDACPGNGLLAGFVLPALESQVFLCYDPINTVNSLCLDQYGRHHGKILLNTVAWRLSTVQNTVSIIGGVSILMPFIWKKSVSSGSGGETNEEHRQRESPSSGSCSEQHNSSTAHSASAKQIARTSPDGICIIQILNLLARLLEKSFENQREFRMVGGPSLLSSALERLPQKVLHSACVSINQFDQGTGDYLSSPFFQALQNLLNAVWDWPERVQDLRTPKNIPGSTQTPPTHSMSSGIGNAVLRQRQYNTLEREIDVHILFNMKVLTRCFVEPTLKQLEQSPLCELSHTQLIWLEFLEDRVKLSPALYRQVIGIQGWFDTLRSFYLSAARHTGHEESFLINLFRSSKGHQSWELDFLEKLSYHVVRIGAAFLCDSVTKEDVRVLLCMACAGGHGASAIPPQKQKRVISDASGPLSSLQSMGSGVLSLFGTIGGQVVGENLLERSTASPSLSWTLVDLLLARDSIRMITVLLRLDQPPKSLFDEFSKVDGVNDLASVLTVNMVACQFIGDPLRAQAIRTIHDYLCRVDKASSNFFSLPSLPIGESLPAGRRGIDAFSVAGGYLSTLHALSQLTDGDEAGHSLESQASMNLTYSTLLELMVTKCPDDSIKMQTKQDYNSVKRHDFPLERYSFQPFSVRTWGSIAPSIELVYFEDMLRCSDALRLVLDDTQLIENQHLLMVLVKLLPRMGLYLKQRVCQDLFLLLKFQPCNRRALLDMPGWEGAFLGLLGSLEEHGSRTSGAQVCFDLAVKLFLLPLQDALLENHDGWRRVETLFDLHHLLVDGENVTLSIIAQLFEDIHRHLQAEGAPATFKIFWQNLKKSCLLVEMISNVVESSSAMSRTIQALLTVIDLCMTLPPQLLSDFQDPRIRSDKAAADGEEFMLRDFCWPEEKRSQEDLERIRGPIVFSFFALSLSQVTEENFRSPCFPKHCKRLMQLVVLLRKLPKVKSLVRWSTTCGSSIKGEKSALVVLTFVKIEGLIQHARAGEFSTNSNEFVNLEHLASLMECICTNHNSLLAQMFNDLDQINRLVYALSKRNEDHDHRPDHWLWQPDIVSSAPNQNEFSEDRFRGFYGARQALKESGIGIQVFMQSRIKTGFESYCTMEMNLANTKQRVKMESLAMAFQQRLAYSEINRLSAKSMVLVEHEMELVNSWYRLIVKSSHEASVWSFGMEKKHWMIRDREDSLRCRRVLQRNYDFNDHSDAIYRTQKGDGFDGGYTSKSRSMIHSPIGAGSTEVLNEMEALEELSTYFVKKTEPTERHESLAAFEYFLWLGGRLECDANLEWFEWLDGKIRNQTSRRLIDVKVSEPSNETVSDKTNSITKTSKDSLLNEVDDWAVNNSKRTLNDQYALRKDEILMHVCSNALWVTPLQVSRGRLEISTFHIFFYASGVVDQSMSAEDQDDIEILSMDSSRSGGMDQNSESPENLDLPKEGKPPLSSHRTMRWSLSELTEIYGRRYLLRETALEFFFHDMTNIFLCFPSVKARLDCFAAILKQPTPFLSKTFKGSLQPKSVFEKSNIQEKWRRREISNFEYIMHLNTMAGRSYNDITQYPVFPWVLSDYTSEDIDLSNPSVYRDLSKPIGALNENRLREFVERYENFSDPSLDIPPFHFGSHYSNAGIVLHYLLRMEPFTSLGIDLQGGRFDCPERLFFSVEDCWLSSMESMSDVKELIPEFFYCPEMFLNLNDFNLGERETSGERIGDVVLPPWAKGSAYEFVRINREALESEYVSQNLHRWVDLIFGYQQRGSEAIKACNVFYYLTYEGAVDLDSILDPVQRHSIENQIAYFGQTPSQLLTRPHPQRQPLAPRARLVEQIAPGKIPEISTIPTQCLNLNFVDAWSDPGNPITFGAVSGGPQAAGGGLLSIWKGVKVSSGGLVATGLSSSSPQYLPPLVSVTALSDRVVAVHEDLAYGSHRIGSDMLVSKLGGLRVLNGAPLTISAWAHPKDKAIIGTSVGKTNLRIGGSSLVCAKQGKLIISGNYLDCSVRAQNLDNAKVECAVVAHRGRVSCLAVCEKEEYLVSGSSDCTVGVWKIGGATDIKEEVMEMFGAPDLVTKSINVLQTNGSQLVTAGISGSYSSAYGSCGSNLISFFRRLSGHISPVTSVEISSGMSLVVSGAENGTVLVHCLEDGSFLRKLLDPVFSPITCLQIGKLTGNIIFYVPEKQDLYSFTVNGHLISKAKTRNVFEACCVSYSKGFGEEVLLAGDNCGLLWVCSVYNFNHQANFQVTKDSCPLRSVSISPSGECIYAGTERGQLCTIFLSEMSATLDL